MFVNLGFDNGTYINNITRPLESGSQPDRSCFVNFVNWSILSICAPYNITISDIGTTININIDINNVARLLKPGSQPDPLFLSILMILLFFQFVPPCGFNP